MSNQSESLCQKAVQAAEFSCTDRSDLNLEVVVDDDPGIQEPASYNRVALLL